MQHQQLPQSAALIQFSRRSGAIGLFDSQMDHQSYVHLKISPARADRSLGHTIYTPALQPYVEVSMSAAQFAEAISTLNMGVGVPCTMRRLEGRTFESIGVEDKREQFQSEITKESAEAIQQLQELMTEIEGLNLPKDAKASLKSKAVSAHRKLTDSMPFITEMYSEAMDDLESKAKIEISAHAAHVVQEHGVAALKMTGQVKNQGLLS